MQSNTDPIADFKRRLDDEIAAMNSLLEEFHDGTDPRSRSTVHCLSESIPLLIAFSRILAPGLSPALWTLCRATLERLFFVAWTVKDEKNAKLFAFASRDSITRQFEDLVTNDTLPVRVKRSLFGTEEAQRALSTFLEAPRGSQLKMVRIAGDCGLSRTYGLRYRLESMMAHGQTQGMPDDLRADLRAVSNGILLTARAIRLVAENWLRQGQPTPGPDIEATLGLS